ncbi:redoxin domain-containing protein [Pseudopedobacter beijingensis]|uniref:Redoxin domain-containing protein n=1 Tax=Pseudopedobacter beijingensis TaxID=1207056 RepID=A0ABW4IBC6_9SPHI
MKKLFYILSLLPFSTFAQQNLTITGQISNKNENKKIYFVHLADRAEKLDSATVTNGKFTFSTQLESPTIAVLILSHNGKSLNQETPKDVFKFFVEPGQINITAKDSINTSVASGVKVLEDNLKFDELLKFSNNKLEQLNIDFSKLSDNKKSDQNVLMDFQDRYQNLIEERQKTIKEFIAQNPKSFISLYYLNNELTSDDMNVKEIESLYNALDANLKKSLFAKMVEEKISLGRVTGIGVNATDFEEKTPEGISVKLSSYKGQYVLLDFWASWCNPCRQENPHLVNAYEKYKDKGFTILGVSIDQDASAWKNAIKTDGLLWAQLMDTSKQIASTYGIDAIPKNFLLDKDGVIIAKNLRGLALEEKLKEIFDSNTKGGK